ncbi:class I SAM-dependent methyltransferase, partial [Streptococcus sobrinus]|uniref:class I SAM-dependent methyltransferase n=1 Tax=Streptococcus sobrinus TaxID=1310 RepID=UPI0021005672
MLDGILEEESRLNWDTFYNDRKKKIPFFINAPDENLVSYFEKGLLQPGKVLELGCGPGRNAIYFAQQGCSVDAVDSAQ